MRSSIRAGAMKQRPLAACLAAICAASASTPALADAPAASTPHAPATLVVANCNDNGPGSLRDTIAAAADGDTIDLTQLGCSTISLTTGSILMGQGSLSLVGPGRDRLTVDGADNDGSALLYHLGQGNLVVQDMTLRNGSKYRNDGDARGGCIHTESNVYILGSDVLDCTANSSVGFAALGGGVFASGRVYLAHSTVSGNAAIAHINGYASGGGIYSLGGVTTVYSTVADNSVRSYSSTPTFGGGIFARGASAILESAIVRNHASRMGGLALADRNGYLTELFNSTVSGNSADYIGGVYSRSGMYLYNSTIADNTAAKVIDRDGHLFGVGLHMGAARLTAYSTIIANNASFETGGSDLGAEAGAQIQGSNNLITASAVTPPPDTISGPVVLGPLVDNGGFTPTQALLPGGAGIDAGRQPPLGAFTYDQRGPGFGRWFGAGPDIGAFENQADQLFSNGFNFGTPGLEGPPTFLPNETFDELTPIIPALPPGWVNNHTGVGGGWSTVSSNAYSRPNAGFTNDQNDISDASLQTSAFDVVANGRLTFTHQFGLEVNDNVVGYDGAVVEISIAVGPFEDIIDAGGSFASGVGYNFTISDCCANPLAGRQAWSGDSNGYQTVSINLPAAANGRSVRVRWRIGTDDSRPGRGYWLDNIHVDVNGTP